MSKKPQLSEAEKKANLLGPEAIADIEFVKGEIKASHDLEAKGLTYDQTEYYDNLRYIVDFEVALDNIDEILELLIANPRETDFKVMLDDYVADLAMVVNNYKTQQMPQQTETNIRVIYLTARGVDQADAAIGTKYNYIYQDIEDNFQKGDYGDINSLLEKLRNGEGVFTSSVHQNRYHRNSGNARGYYYKINEETILLLGVCWYNSNNKEAAHEEADRRTFNSEAKAAADEIRALFASGDNAAIADFLTANAMVEGSISDILSKGIKKAV